jgi:uncharacterized protein (UPF0276 family)
VTDFRSRLDRLPVLGLGVSTEYGASLAAGALDPMQLRREHPQYAGFLEVGVELVKGLDAPARAWAASGAPTTYHFLDINLDEPEDLDPAWLAGVGALCVELGAAWLCGDAGLWHFGRRDRGHMLLLPPVLIAEAVAPMAEGIVALRDALGLEVLPENPPGTAFVGDLHLLEFFARVAEAADTGLLLDCAHLAMYQRLTGRAPLDGLDHVPWDRVVELHVAGGSEREHDGFMWIEDEHGPELLPDTWAIAQAALRRASNLRAVVVECERNPIPAVLPLFARVAAELPAHMRAVSPDRSTTP